MKNAFIICAAFFLAVLDVGCRKGPTEVTVTGGDFPPSSKFSITLYAPKQSVAVGESFEIRVVLYNVTGVFGVATEIAYPSASVEVISVTRDASFSPSSKFVEVNMIQPDSNRVSAALAIQNTGSASSFSGSGVVWVLTCKAKIAGNAPFILSSQKLEIQSSDGTLISNFSSLLIENLSISIR